MNEDIPGQQLENQVELQPERKAYQFFDASWPEQLKYFPAAHGVACIYREEELPEYTASGLRINVRTQKDIDDAVADGRCLKADTIDELLSKIEGIDVDEAKKSIERYNELCKAGEDTDFSRALSACSPWRMVRSTLLSAVAPLPWATWAASIPTTSAMCTTTIARSSRVCTLAALRRVVVSRFSTPSRSRAFPAACAWCTARLLAKTLLPANNELALTFRSAATR